MHEQCLCDVVGKRADQFQSYHEEGGTFLVLAVVLSCVEREFRRLLVSALLGCVRKGSHQWKFSRRLSEPKRFVRTWRRYTDTGTVDGMRRSGRPKATTAFDDRYLRCQFGETMKATPPC